MHVVMPALLTSTLAKGKFLFKQSSLNDFISRPPAPGLARFLRFLVGVATGEATPNQRPLLNKNNKITREWDRMSCCPSEPQNDT